jgi:transaldolase
MLDNNIDGIKEISKMQLLVSNLKSQTRVFAASIRDTSQLVELAASGCHTFTFSPSIADGLLSNPLTSSAVAEFDWAVSESRKYSAR